MTEWSDILKTILGASIGSAVLTSMFTLWRERGKRAQDATYLAMRLAVILEAFASACADLIMQNRSAPHFPEEQFPRWNVRLPSLEAFPEDGEGWKALGANEASDCLNLSSRIAGSQAIISSVAEHQEEEMERVVREQAWERGLEAWNLARRLRSSHGLHHIVPVFDYADHLMQARLETERDDRLREEDRRREAEERRQIGQAAVRLTQEREMGILEAIGEAARLPPDATPPT